MNIIINEGLLKEGGIFYKKHDNILNIENIEKINSRFSWVNKIANIN